MPDEFSLSSHVIRENPFMAYNHIEVGPVSRGHAQVYLDIKKANRRRRGFSGAVLRFLG